MMRCLVANAANFKLWPRFDFLNALHRCWAVVAVLLCAGGTAIAADSPVIARGAKLEVLGEGYPYAYGSAADRDGNVFFTDQFANRIVKWTAADGTFSDWLKPSGFAKGLYFDTSGNLLATAMERGELWSIAPDKALTVLAATFDGKQFNGPNDVWISPDGASTSPIHTTARHS